MNDERASETITDHGAQPTATPTQLDESGANIPNPQSPSPSEDTPRIDMENLSRVLSMSFKPEPEVTPEQQFDSRQRAETGGLPEEIAEDMLELLRYVTAIERTQRDLSLRLEQVETILRDTARQYAREVDTLRRELLGERKALSALSVFNSVLPMLDSLRAMRARLPKMKNSPVRQQLDALIQTLNTTLRSLGFTEFEVEKDESFDPRRMECLGFASGPPGVVLNVVRPGYCTREVVVRPAGVIVARSPHTIKAPTTEEL